MSDRTQHSPNDTEPLAHELSHFRRQLEQEAEQPLDQLEVNAALLLHDLMAYLNFNAQQSESVLGEHTSQSVRNMLGDTDDESVAQ